MPAYRLGNHVPQIHPEAWLAPGASVIGRVRIGAETSVWYSASIRGDNENITIGARCSIQDGAVLHADEGIPLVMGESITAGHQVMLHGCRIGSGTLIGIQTIILNHAQVGSRCLVGAGSLITEGKVFPDGVLIMGRPAKVVRDLTAAELDRLVWSANHYVEQMQRHRAGIAPL